MKIEFRGPLIDGGYAMNTRKLVRVALCAAAVILLSATGGALPEGSAEVSRHFDASARGITVRDLSRHGWPDAEVWPEAGSLPVIGRGPLAHYAETTTSDSDWVLVDSDTFRAYVPAGDAFTIRFDLTGDSLGCI